MNSIPVIKKTSFGISDPSRREAVRARGYTSLKTSDPRKHIPYIDRYGTLKDEMGTTIPSAERMDELEKRLALSVDPNRDIFCLSVSLPHQRTAEAQAIVENYCRENFGTFLSAHHEKNHAGQRQEHIHLAIFNDQKHHPLNRLIFLQGMRREIGKRFQTAGISFSPAVPRDERPDQVERILDRDNRAEIEKAMTAAFGHTLYMSRNIEDWEDALTVQSLSITRETKSTITLKNHDGYKMRLERLSEGKLKTRADIERYLVSVYKLNRHILQ